MFTQKEREDVENWRNERNPTKGQCHWLQQYKNRILSATGSEPEKRECFCAQKRRKQYKTDFYKFWDEQNI